MARVPLYNTSGGYVKTVDVAVDELAPAVNLDLLRRAVLAYEAARRQGNADTKERSEIAGSSKKPWRQKGTGHARAGTKRSPLWRTGGTIFGPRPRSYRHRLPLKARRRACAGALRAKIEDGEVAFLEAIEIEPPKTKTIARILETMGAGDKVLIATDAHDPVVVRCGRNLPGVSILPVDQVNAYHLVRGGKIVMTQGGFERIQKRVGAPGKEVAS